MIADDIKIRQIWSEDGYRFEKDRALFSPHKCLFSYIKLKRWSDQLPEIWMDFVGGRLTRIQPLYDISIGEDVTRLKEDGKRSWIASFLIDVPDEFLDKRVNVSFGSEVNPILGLYPVTEAFFSSDTSYTFLYGSGNDG